MFYNKKIFERCFNYKGKYWYKNIKEIPLYFKLMHHLVKYGYDEYATWETFDWFIDTMKSILTRYRKSHIGYPLVSFDDEDIQRSAAEAFDVDLDRMIELLDDMDEDNPKYDAGEYEKDYMKKDVAKNKAKDEFFELFSEHFYYLWD